MKANYLTRQSNFELLRIFAMFFIVIHHYAYHGIRQNFNPILQNIWLDGDLYNKIVTSICIPGGPIGVGIFFLLTGYFMYDCNYKIQRLVKLLIQVYFYSFVMFAIYMLLKYFHIYDFSEITSSNFELLKKTFFPITSRAGGWFTQTYFVLFLFVPVINHYLKKINTEYSLYFLITIWLLWYLSTPYLQSYYSELQKGVFFYLLGVQLKRSNYDMNKICAASIFVLMYILLVLIDIKLLSSNACVSTPLKHMLGIVRHLICIPFAVIAAFCFFKKINIPHHKLINSVAATTFGIYLIHESEIGRPLIWNYIFHTLDMQYQLVLFPLYMVGTCILLFCILSAIDYFRIQILELKYLPYCYNILNRLKNKATK